MVNTTSALVVAALASIAAAHGHLQSVIANSKTYTAFLPIPTPDFKAAPPSIVRRIGGDGPVLDILSKDITCNFNAAPISDNGISRTGEVAAGTNVVLKWNGWPHSGPILTYLASCNGDCGKFNGSEGKVWFKIDERGYDTQWATQYLYDAGFKWNVTIPACLAPGEYLLRHEIIALSDCKTVGKCQFYPECVQLKVTGKGTTKPSSLVGFPGAYQKTDPGILWDTNTADPKNYKLPGPAIFKCPS